MKLFALFVTCGAVTVSSLGLASNAAWAKKSKSTRSEQFACPIDEPVRVASGDAINRFSILANCQGRIIVAPASEPAAPKPAVRIVPQMWETDAPDVVAPDSSGIRPIAHTIVPEAANSILALKPADYSTPFDHTIQKVAQRHRVDPLLLHAVIRQESGYRHSVRSHAGAIGLMQIMPATGESLGVATENLDVPESNVDAGARLLKRLYSKYSGNFNLILAAYNAGEGAVKKYGNRIPPYYETQNYVKRVLAHYDRLVSQTLGAGASR